MNEVDVLLEEIKDIQHDIMLIQLNCMHINTDRQSGCSTRYAESDVYWVDHTCHKCSKKWREYV
jgi:hypothetical protein